MGVFVFADLYLAIKGPRFEWCSFYWHSGVCTQLVYYQESDLGSWYAKEYIAASLSEWDESTVTRQQGKLYRILITITY